MENTKFLKGLYFMLDFFYRMDFLTEDDRKKISELQLVISKYL